MSDTLQPTSSGVQSPRISRRKLAAGCLALIVIVAAILGYRFYIQLIRIREIKIDSSAQSRVAEILIDYMERNGGEWPKNWEDLWESHDIVSGRSGRGWSLAELQERVVIQFDAKPAEMRRASSGQIPPFHVVYRRHGKQPWYVGLDPNSMILQYLLERAARPGTYQYPKHPVAEEEPSRNGLCEVGAQWELENDGRVVKVRMSSPEGAPIYSDAAMVHLKALKQLRELDLGYSDITDAGLACIENATELRTICLYGTKVTDGGLSYLYRMDKLETLVLASSNFSDAGLEYVGKLHSLKLLNLNGARVTDAGLKHLYGLKSLQELMLYGTKVTTSAVEKLRQALPNCKIEWQSSTIRP